MAQKFYKDYFNIDPKYFPQVTAALIESGQVNWKSFYPDKTFEKLLEKTHEVLSAKVNKSLWVEGTYGSGKSHAALTIKSLLDATDEEVQEYFDDYGLSRDLCQKIIADKNDGSVITIHRIGSSSISSDQDLILAVQSSIIDALEKNGIKNMGASSLKEAALKWFAEKETHDFFNSVMSKEKYAWMFSGLTVDDLIERLNNGSPEQVNETMGNIISVAKDYGISPLLMDIQDMVKWIKDLIEKNSLKAILFIWDEFTEFLQNNPNSLTGFQTLVEISLSSPFYFMIVSHECRSLFVDSSTARKILDRFQDPIKIDLPDNTAFRLMANAMKITNDPVLRPEWESTKADLIDDLTPVCDYITATMKSTMALGQRNSLKKDELLAIVPIHPYAALVLKHLASAFKSNQRSMFDFIINENGDTQAFKWFIANHGPYTRPNLLTVDMLWSFFYGNGQNSLNDEVRVILDSYNIQALDKLNPKEQQVLKTILILQAISLRISDVELLRPTEKNVDMAYSGVGEWSKGEGLSVANNLVSKGILFKRTVNGKAEYTIANSEVSSNDIDKLKSSVKGEIKTSQLVLDADLLGAVSLPPAISGRYVLRGASSSNFSNVKKNIENEMQANRFYVLVTFALNEQEAAAIKSQIMAAVNTGSNIIYVDASSTTMGKYYDMYVESLAYSKYYAKSNKTSADGYNGQANTYLGNWKSSVENGSFILYSKENASGIYMPTLTALQDELVRYNRSVYYYGPEQYNVIGTMFTRSALALGAECGITETVKNTYRSGNANTSLEKALVDAWRYPDYWKDTSKRGATITRVKLKVEEIIENSFASPSGQVCMEDIYNALQEAPFGFLPNNICAFILGFVLKEYAVSDYFWSNGQISEPMSVDKMKQMIANVINQSVSPDKKYRPEYIRAMSAEQKAFLECTSKVFGIPASQCGRIETARDQIRISMKKLIFPIWTIKYVPDKGELSVPFDKISDVIDCYSSIANTGNSGSKDKNESMLADDIGKCVLANPGIIGDLAHLLTSEMCRAGMLAYLDTYKGGILKTLAEEIKDGGAYLDNVKQRFNSDAANWVWNVDTANERIDDVILDYHIISESAKSLPGVKTIRDVVAGWNSRTNNIKISYECLKKVAGDLASFLEKLFVMKQTNTILEQNKEKFYMDLVAQREAFESFYRNQVPLFKAVADIFLADLDGDDDIQKLYRELPSGQFTRPSTDYLHQVEGSVKNYISNQAKKRMRDLWMAKTGSKDPRDWSQKYSTPILCMLSDDERAEAKGMFAVMMENSPSESSVNSVIEYLNRVTYYDRLASAEARDKCFMERVVGDYSVLINNPQAVRDELISHCPEPPYYWMDNSTVQRLIELMATRKYKTGGSESVLAVIDNMNETDLRSYLKDLISDNVKVGIEILKNK